MLKQIDVTTKFLVTVDDIPFVWQIRAKFDNAARIASENSLLQIRQHISRGRLRGIWLFGHQLIFVRRLQQIHFHKFSSATDHPASARGAYFSSRLWFSKFSARAGRAAFQRRVRATQET
ncbi:MAG: hypothetical protein WDM76_14950 [Limisphaerales bacterium]